MYYGDVLPKELILQLSLYLNYRDIWLLNDFSTIYRDICMAPDIWLYKIREELGYSNEFINQYVYDSINKTKKTLLPLNEKYIELKSRTRVDLGSEYYKTIDVLLYKASRIKDHKLARYLIDYFLKWYSGLKPLFTKLIITGAFSTGNTKLVYDIMRPYGVNSRSSNDLKNTFYAMIGLSSVIEGYYEAPKKIRETLNLKNYGVTASILSQLPTAMMIGLAAGNHLDELKALNPDPNNINLMYDLSMAANKSGAYDVINYYNFHHHGDIEIFVKYNGITDRIKISDIPIGILLSQGYAEYLPSNKEIINNLINALQYNHLDVIIHYTSVLKDFFNKYISQTNYSHWPRTMLPTTYDYIKTYIYSNINSLIELWNANADLKEYLISMNFH